MGEKILTPMAQPALIRSATERVVRQASSPVLVVPANARNTGNIDTGGDL